MVYIKCKINLWLILALMLLIAIVSTSSAQDISANQYDPRDLKDITSRVYCPCGCGYVLASCDCETAVSTIKNIKGMLESGKTSDQILMNLVSHYGPSILVQNDRQTYSKKTNGIDTLPLYFIGIGGAAIVAYKLGQRKSNGENWKIRKKERQKRN